MSLPLLILCLNQLSVKSPHKFCWGKKTKFGQTTRVQHAERNAIAVGSTSVQGTPGGRGPDEDPEEHRGLEERGAQARGPDGLCAQLQHLAPLPWMVKRVLRLCSKRLGCLRWFGAPSATQSGVQWPAREKP